MPGHFLDLGPVFGPGFFHEGGIGGDAIDNPGFVEGFDFGDIAGIGEDAGGPGGGMGEAFALGSEVHFGHSDTAVMGSGFCLMYFEHLGLPFGDILG